MSKPRALAAVACLGSVLALTALGEHAARADVVPGYALDRFDPSDRGSRWFTLESLDDSGQLAPALGVVGDFGYLPLKLHDVNGGYVAVVETQLAFHVGASLTLFDRLRLAASLPIYAEQSGTTIQRFDGTYLGAKDAGVGDVRVGVDGRIVGDPKSVVRVGVGARVWLPTGDSAKYTGDGDFSVAGFVNVAGDIGPFAYAARAGYLYRNTKRTFGPTPVGDELPFGASVGWKLWDEKLLVGPEAQASVALSDTGSMYSKNIVPAHLLIGGHFAEGDFRFGLGAGPGLSTASGTPAVRVVASIEWAPQPAQPKQEAAPIPVAAPAPPLPPPPRDRDGDGVPDALDACPDTSGVPTDNPRTNGCRPPPPDRDGDGIPDKDDACPDAKGAATNDPTTNGCPPDREHDD